MGRIRFRARDMVTTNFSDRNVVPESTNDVIYPSVSVFAVWSV